MMSPNEVVPTLRRAPTTVTRRPPSPAWRRLCAICSTVLTAKGIAAMAAMPLAVSTVEQIAQSLRQAGDGGRRVPVVGAMRNVGTTSFGDIITRDQYSPVHLVATGNVGNDGPALAASPMLATVIEALVRSYDHVVIDVGSAADIAVERFAPLTARAVLVAADPASPATRSARERLMMAGFADVTLLAGAPQVVAA